MDDAIYTILYANDTVFLALQLSLFLNWFSNISK